MGRWTSKEERGWRNKRILEKADMGCAYDAIGRQYGMSAQTVSTLVRRLRIANKQNTKVWAGNNRYWERCSSLDGLYG
jgi:Mor family transcriptional regulator